MNRNLAVVMVVILTSLGLLVGRLTHRYKAEQVVIEPRMAFGFYIVTIIFLLALTVGLGEVRAETSAGLDSILKGLETLATFWAGWAFREAVSK